MSGIKLFVDDWREAPEGWHWARTITEAVRLLEAGFVEVVSLDHDIVKSATGMDFSDENFSTVARYLAVLPPDRLPVRVYIHTANPEGAKLMMAMLQDKIEVVRIEHSGAVAYKGLLLEAERQRESQ